MRTPQEKLKDLIISAIENNVDPYPAFSDPELIKSWKEKHFQEIKDKYGEFPCEDLTFGVNLWEDISDDIKNCGRNPLACLMEHSIALYVISQEEPEVYQSIIEDITYHIYSELTD